MVPSMNLPPTLHYGTDTCSGILNVNYYRDILTPRQTKYDWKAWRRGRNLALSQKSYVSRQVSQVYWTTVQHLFILASKPICQFRQGLVCAFVARHAQITFW